MHCSGRWAETDGSATPVRVVIADPANDVWASVVSLLEITVKLRIGKLRADFDEVTRALAPAGFRLLDLRPAHLIQMTRLPFCPDHRDPFDHALIAQAIAEDMTFVSDDRNATRYPCGAWPAPIPRRVGDEAQPVTFSTSAGDFCTSAA